MRACLTTACTASWIIDWRNASRACSNACGAAVRWPSVWITCQPYRVCTGACVTPLSGSANAASANSGSMSPFLKKPRSPPSVAPGSVLLALARTTKSPPLPNCAIRSFAFASSFTRMWRACTSGSPGLLASVAS